MPYSSVDLLGAALALLALVVPVSIAGTNIALALATAAFLVRLASGAPWQWRHAWIPATWCLCLYCATAVLTACTGVAPAVSFSHLNKDFHKLWVIVLLLLAFRGASARRLPVALAIGFVFAAGVGIGQSLLGTYGYYHDCHIFLLARAGAFVHPVTFGEILGLGLLGGLSWLRSARRPAIVFLILLIPAFILGHVRGAFLGVLAGAGAMCAADPALRRWIKWGVLAAVLGAVLMEALPTGRSIIASVKESGATVGVNQQLNRLILWDVAWHAFKDHPWFGVGPSNYATVYPRYFQGIVEGIQVWTSAHNIILHQMAERGLAGLAALLALGWALLAGAWRRARKAPDAWNLWALGATAAFFVMNLTETAFQVEQITTLFLLIWARAEAGQ